MANVNAPFGLRPIRNLGSASFNGVSNPYVLKTGSTCYQGDLMSVDAAGTVVPSTANDGIKIIGVAAHYMDDSASAGGKAVQIYDDPDIIWAIMCDATGTALVAADRFSCGNHIATAGDTTTKMSKHQWNQTSIATTAKDLKFVRLSPVVNNAFGAYAIIEVMINNHFFGKQTAGI